MFVSRALLAMSIVAGSLTSVEAHNGAVAVAAPASGIVVDGDLSDWLPNTAPIPAEALRSGNSRLSTTRYGSIFNTSQRVENIEYGESPVDAADFSATMLTAYDAESYALYVAIQTSDQSVWIDTTAQSTWNNQDGCELYLALHDTTARVVRQYSIYGDELALGSGTDVEYAVSLSDSGTSYEWRIDLSKVFGTEFETQSNVTLGFDISVSDYDADGSYSWLSWGPGIRKFQRSDRLGDLLLSRSHAIGLARGRLTWSIDGQPAAGRRIRLHAHSKPSFWVDVHSDDAGQWQIPLPVGRYYADESSVVDSNETTIDVVDGPGTKHLFVLREAIGQPLGIKAGEVIRAGGGDLTPDWVSFSPEDGLPFPRVDAMAEDHNGRLWLGSRVGGLCYFDGQNFVQFTTAHGLPNDQVYSLATDFAGRVWIGTRKGLLYYDGSDFVAFTTRDGLVDDHISALTVARDSTIWIGTTQGVSLYDGRRFIDLKSENGLTSGEVLTLMEDSQDRMWIGSFLGLAYYDGSDVQSASDGLNQTTVFGLVETEDGQVLASTSKGLFAEKNGRFEKINFAGMTPTAATGPIMIDHAGLIWVVRADEIYRSNSTGDFDVVRGGSNRYIRVLLKGRHGYLWAGTEQGLWRWHSEMIAPYRQGWLKTKNGSKSWYSAGSRETVSDLEPLADILIPRSDDGVWIAADNKVASVDSKLRFTEEVTLDTTRIITNLLEDSNGTLWIGVSANTAGERVFSYRGGQLDSLQLGESVSRVTALHEDIQGTLWIGTQSALWRVRGDTLDRFTVSEGLNSNFIQSIGSDPRGWVWISTKGGICLYRRGVIHQWKLDVPGEFQRLVSIGYCTIIHVDQNGRTWFGFDDGMFVLQSNAFDGANFLETVVEAKLDASVIRMDVNAPNAFTQDERGRLLAGGRLGITVYDTTLSQTIGYRDGLIPPVFDIAPIGDQLAVLSPKGLLIFRRDGEKPRIEIEEVFGERRYDLDSSMLELRAFEQHGWSFRLPSLNFEYRGTSLKTRPSAMAFQYRLLGYSDDWTVTRDARVAFPRDGEKHLIPGEYTFEVRAIDRDLVYGEPDSINIKIVWPTWLIAQNIGLFFGICAVVSFILYSRKSARELGVRVEERTRELSISNTSLNQRMAEQACLYQISSLLDAPDLSPREMVDRALLILPHGFTDPHEVRVRVQLGEYENSSLHFSDTPLQFRHRVQRRQFSVTVEVAFPDRHGSAEGHASKDLKKTSETPRESDTVVAVTEALALANERFQAERQLRESEDYLRSIVSYLADGLVAVDDQLRIVSFNPAAERIFDYTATEVIGRSVDLLLPPNENKSENLLFHIVAVDGGKEYDEGQQTAEVFGQRKGGGIFPMDLAVGVFDHTAGRQLIGLVRDITSRTEDQRRLNQAQKMEAIGQLASGVAHEINTPMQYVASNISFIGQGLSELETVLVALMQLVDSVKEEQDLPPDLRKLLNLARDTDLEFVHERLPEAVEDAMIGTDRVSEIVQALREAAHPGTGQKVDSNISTILHNAAIVSRNSWKYHAELLEDYDESCPMVAVFVGELSQAFINLIVNAADAVQEEIERAAPESQAKGEIRLTSQLVDSFVEVRISDTGGGVSPEIRSKIFDYFFTTKAPGKGTGQGLAIAYDVIVNKHGGELSFDSVPQRGSTFIVRLPIHPL